MSDSDPGNPSGPRTESPLPARVRAEWTTAAEKVFASALTDPELYQRATSLVGRTVQALRGRGQGLRPLLDSWAQPHELVDQVLADDSRLSSDGLEPTQVVAAACAMRYREVVDEIAAAGRRDALATADDAHQWVVLEESGVHEGDPFVPYHRLEAHPATGLTIVVTTRPDDELAACIHTVEVFGIDVRTGRLTAAPADIVTPPPPRKSTTGAERELEVSRLKQELLSNQD